MFLDFIFNIWRRFNGSMQWWLLWLFSPKFMVSVSGIVQDKSGNVLLQRHRHWVSNVWGLPGGIVHSGERLEDAFAREIFEETALRVTDIALIRLKSGYRLRLEAYFRAKLVESGTAQTMKLQTSEVVEAKFFPVDQLPPNMFVTQRELVENTIVRANP